MIYHDCQTGYTTDIPGIYHVYTGHIPYEGHLRARLVAHPRLEASDLEFLRIFSVLATERPMLGPSKVPQPGVDLVNMAAPPRGRACTIGTAALKSIQLSAAVLMWNSWGCISVQKAWNERDSADEVLHPSDVERGNRWGLVYPVNFFRFHDSSCPQASSSKGLKKTRLSGMSSPERLKLSAAVPMGRSVQWKDSWGRTNHILSGSKSNSATS